MQYAPTLMGLLGFGGRMQYAPTLMGLLRFGGRKHLLRHSWGYSVLEGASIYSDIDGATPLSRHIDGATPLNRHYERFGDFIFWSSLREVL